MWDCIIIGAGPSGLMTGIEASKNNKVLIIEKNAKPGRKLLLTGNGRCNITNLKENNAFIESVNYNKKYLYSTIYNFGPREIYNYFTENKVMLKEEDDNKIFPVSDKASDILNALLKNTNNLTINYNESVTNIIKNDEYYEVITNKSSYQARNLVIATGGTSYKNTGSTGDHINFAKMLNQPYVPLFPAEVGIITKEKLNIPGTSFNDVKVKYLKYKTRGKLMFTHKGLSGSAIMLLSEHIYKNEEKTIYIDFLPNKTIDELLDEINNTNKEKDLLSFLNNYFTKRFSTYLIEKLSFPSNIKIKNLNKKDLEKLIDKIKNSSYEVESVDDINNAYVTGGGIDLKYINTKTFASTINKNLYFVGEALDFHGPIGGYNLTIALSTGYSAGISIK